MLRFSVEDGPRRASVSAVYALFGVALIPVSFLAIRLAEDFIPTTFTRDGPPDDGDDVPGLTTVCWLAITLLAYTFYRVELLGKRLDANLRDPGGGQPHEPERLCRCGVRDRLRDPARLRRDHRCEAVAARARHGRAGRARSGAEPMAQVLVVPALLAYGEAAFAYAGELRGQGSPDGWRPGASGSAGWRRRRCSSAGASPRRAFREARGPARSGCFVWLVVRTPDLGCTPRYRLLGLTVMPVAAVLLALAWAGGTASTRATAPASCSRRTRC